jgi:hypothetical protein
MSSSEICNVRVFFQFKKLFRLMFLIIASVSIVLSFLHIYTCFLS